MLVPGSLATFVADSVAMLAVAVAAGVAVTSAAEFAADFAATPAAAGFVAATAAALDCFGVTGSDCRWTAGCSAQSPGSPGFETGTKCVV